MQELQPINNFINLPHNEGVDVTHLQRLFDNMSECYKLFWFRAVIEEVNAGKTAIPYDNLINDMIADAWYMVNEYKLNLGPKDTLENLVISARESTGLISSEKREKIIETISGSSDKLLKQKKLTLTLNVPYRLLTPFTGLKSKDFDCSTKKIAEKLNEKSNLIYRFGDIRGLDTVIYVSDSWAQYICTNFEILSGWVNYNLVCYLQKRNPSVPGIPYKLFPPQQRNLTKVIRYWKVISELTPITDTYSDRIITAPEISIDHFVPWSYVAHDELWNLSPTTRSINSSKSNNLPEWELYFKKLADSEYTAYKTANSYTGLKGIYNQVLDEHVNSSDVKTKLYRPALSQEEFFSVLEEIIRPVYEAANNLGYSIWRKE